MPYSITTKDGITINNIPDDVPPDSQALKDRVAAIRSGQSPVQVAPSHEVTPQMVPSHTPGAALPEVPAGQEPETTFSGVTGGLIRGAGPYGAGALVGGAIGTPAGGVGAVPGAIIGAASVGAAKFAGDPITGWINRTFGTNWATPTETMEFLMDKLGIERPDTPAERVAQTAADVAGGSVGGMALGKLMAGSARPLVAGVGKTLMSQPGQQIAGALVSGAASQTAAELGGGPGTQFGAGLLGGMVGARAAQPRTPVQRAYQLPDIAEAEKAGIKVMTTDIAPPETFASKWLQGIGEKIPIAGTGGLRKAQQAQRVEAVKNVLSEYGVGPGFLPEDASKPLVAVFNDLAERRSAMLSKYAGMKGEVIKRLDGAGTVPVPKTTAAIDAEINRLASMKNKDANKVIDVLADWKTSVQDQGLSNVEALRAQIGQSFESPDLVSARDLATKSLSGIYKFVREDMGDFIKATGQKNDYTKWAVANKRLSEMAGEVETGALRSVLKSGQASPEDVSKMLFSAKPSEVKRLVSGLTPTGRENAKMAVIARVAEQSGGIENLSPEKFITSARKLGGPIGVVFDAQEAERIRGLSRALQMTAQASKAALSTPTGMQGVPIVGTALLTDIFGGAGAALGSMATYGAMARMYESKLVRDTLMRLPKTKPGSPEEAALFKRLLAATQAQETTKEENQ